MVGLAAYLPVCSNFQFSFSNTSAKPVHPGENYLGLCRSHRAIEAPRAI
jgi:hypothetical protein